MINKPCAPACVRNQAPILSVLQNLFDNNRAVLEIGSGTGQHAVYFGERLPHLTWYTSDLVENHDDITAWLEDADLPNVRFPLQLDITQDSWPAVDVDAVFSANTVHIVSWPAVKNLFAAVGELLPAGGKFVVYGPINYHGQYTSDSNRQFDDWLKARDPASGIRDFDDLDELALQAGMQLQEDFEMPANNRILYWCKP